MDEKKICFIMCVNHERHQREALYYINRLNVPDGYTVEALTVREAHGMAAGYNEAMTASDAKYKVYLHQDVLIVERDFLFSLLELFQDSRIGMVGMVGAPKLSPDGVMWNGPRVGKIYSSTVDCMNAVTFGEIGKGGGKTAYQEVEAADGLLLATQHDIWWREDVFQKWDFYDVSQCFEFRKQGYRVVVPQMERPWCIHDSGYVKWSDYDGERRKFLKEYGLQETEEERMMQQVTLVLTMHNQMETLKACLMWLGEVPGIHRMVFLDNGSSDGTGELLSVGCDSIVFDEVKGYGVLWNAAVGNFPMDDVIVFLDVRYLPGKHCLGRLMHALGHGGVGLVGPRSNGGSGNQQIGMGSIEDMLDLENDVPLQEEKGAWFPVVGIDAGIFAVSKEALQASGGFREDLLDAENVLTDFTLRMLQKGFRPAVCQNAYAYDLCAGREAALGFDYEKDNALIRKAWGMTYFNRIPNRNLADMIGREKEEEFRVLEVGCDLGATLLEIQRRHPNCSIHGVELNSAAAGIAGLLTDVKQGNIEEECASFQGTFDYIILGTYWSICTTRRRRYVSASGSF